MIQNPFFFASFQVFVLLETLYRNFDIIARRRRVYKVETIGGMSLIIVDLEFAWPRTSFH